ncbi:transporter substrate-binding domain-containing protein [Hoeflea olei]|uniref:Amino acid ABC transporter substrate-binding protein n=1 Tax=Hoeflea olei TaxID=1480615 RepID=A0A1C1YXR5_9HYPH|nr:transporter substrate-binding domain-containing protein [Hoeflea olei]OCW58354.1 hypothetical protein AWJ14_13555 [Hoeflea olei]
MNKITRLLACAAAVFATTASHAEDLDKIRSEGRIVVATEAAFAPFEFVQDGKIVGFGSELLKQVAADLEVEVEQLDLPFQGILAGLAAGQYDLVATSVAINPERAATYAFTRPFAAIENVIVTAADADDITSVDDLAGKLVGTQLGSSTEAVARDIDKMLADKGEGFSDLRLYQTFPDTAFALRSGQVDAIIVANLTAGEFMASAPGEFRVAGSYGDPVMLSWVLRPGNPGLLGSINGTIGRLADSGALAEMQERWIGVATPVPAENYLPDGAVQ